METNKLKLFLGICLIIMGSLLISLYFVFGIGTELGRSLSENLLYLALSTPIITIATIVLMTMGIYFLASMYEEDRKG